MKYLISIFILLFSSAALSSPSDCFGTTKNGRLVNSVVVTGYPGFEVVHF